METSALALLLERGDQGALLAVLTRLGKLDPASLAAAACTCRSLRALLASSHSPWLAAVEADWSDKLYVGEACRRLLAEGKPREALVSARLDSRRTRLSTEELCSIPWRFRFKATAGETWTLMDRWWRGKTASRVRFSADGRVERLVADEDDIVWDVSITWTWARFGAHFTSDAPAERGQLLRLRVEERSVPTYIVRRTRKWGWVMESIWGQYTSVEPPGRAAPQDPEMDVEQEWRWPALQAMEAAMFNAGLETLGADFDSDDEAEGGEAE